MSVGPITAVCAVKRNPCTYEQTNAKIIVGIVAFEFAATSVAWDSGVSKGKLGCQIICHDKDKGWIAGGDPKQVMQTTTTLIVAESVILAFLKMIKFWRNRNRNSIS